MPWLPKRTLDLVNDAVEALRDVFSDRLEAVALVGAAASPVRHDRARAPRVLALVADEIGTEDLRRLGRTAKGAMRRGVRVLLLTSDELATSSDVFAFEVAEWRDRHVLLHGDDPFEDVELAPADLRRSLEQASRGLGRQLRNRLLASIATDGRRADAQSAVAAALERLVEIAHHALALSGEDAPGEEAALVSAWARKADVDPAPIVKLLEELRADGQLADPMAAHEVTSAFADASKRAIDQLDVS